MRCDPLGSVWRRWDLHVHTPASYDYANKGINAKQLVDGLVAAGVEVVAITDHHIIDVEFIRLMQELTGNHLTILPGIELRSQLGGRESVHYVGIFSEDCDLEDIWIKLQSIGISKADIQKTSPETVFVPFEKGCEKIIELGGIISVHAGAKSNSIERLSNADIIKRAIKTEYVQKYLHAYEVGKVSDCEDYNQIVFPAIGKTLPLLLCSDNHSIFDYNIKCPMWIKADPGFAGLIQLLNEPTGRICLSDRPESIIRVEQNKTKYISSISFERTDRAAEGVNWFSGFVPLNSGLVAIIGKKGSGKSAITDILALLCNSQVSGSLPFLCSDRFLSPKTKFGGMFRATAHWYSQNAFSRTLCDTTDPSSPELVKYIPQSYLETICSELKDSSETAFYRELMGIIFSHVGEAERLGKETLPDLIAFITGEKESRIEQLLTKLRRVNAAIVALEDQQTVEYRRSVETQLEQRRLELQAHVATKPVEVKEPQLDPQAQEATQSLTKDLSSLQSQVDELVTQLAHERERDRIATLQLASAKRLLTRLENLEQQISTFYTESAEDGKVLGIDLKELISLKTNRQLIQTVCEQATKEQKEANNALSAEFEGSSEALRVQILEDMESKRKLLDEPNRKHQAYLQQLADWTTTYNEKEGDASKADTVKGLEAKLASLHGLPSKITEQKMSRAALVREIFNAKEELLAEYQQLYSAVQGFIDNHKLAKDSALQFTATIAVDGFVEGLLAYIHQGRKGSFQGEREGREQLQELINASDFTTEVGVHAFIDLIQYYLEHDKRDRGHKIVRLQDQLRQNTTPESVYNFLYGLEYLTPRFELRWQGKPLGQLSPGERGNLLLIFYLLIDKRDMPLIIDQPEENLDNQTIASMLVPAIKETKERRQIIIVTHNPNIAVVCDADQIIHAELDKTDGNRITYTSGAIENPKITQLIIDVLEGTKPAFDMRDAKYEILEHVKEAVTSNKELIISR